ncbi:MAG: galactose ABC transporter substrate-binding protein [Ruminococcaceae bacterium]|nr:galactose ABC transporter substrate-binding protein [Oscillospiraceae bacterium]
MKKFLTLFLTFTMVFTLASCTSKAPETLIEETKPKEQIEEIIEEVIPEEIEVKAGVFWYDFSDAFLSTVRDALNSELDALGIQYTNYDAASTQARQNVQIESAIANGVNLLIVNIVDTAAIDAAQNITDIARVADVPVIFFNREVDDSVINSYENACFVGTRAAEAGEAQGIMIGKYIAENYDDIDLNCDGYISYIYLVGEIGCYYSDATIDVNLEDHPYYAAFTSSQTNVATRLLNITTPKIELICSEAPDVRSMSVIPYCNAVLTMANKPELTYYDANNTDKYQPSNWSKTTAFEIMETALSTNPMDGDAPIEVVIANNDDAALGCVEALNNKGWNTGEGNTIPVFGVDYTADAAAAIEEGKMVGSILQSATGMAETIADLVENVMNGEHVFDGAVEVFNVDEDANKIRVPYEIKMKEEN